MSDENFSDLKREHKRLKKEIKRLQSIPGESFVLSQLKRRKLQVKELISAAGGMTSGMASEKKLAEQKSRNLPVDDEPEEQALSDETSPPAPDTDKDSPDDGVIKDTQSAMDGCYGHGHPRPNESAVKVA